jgi:hypothetical protein
MLRVKRSGVIRFRLGKWAGWRGEGNIEGMQ